MSMFSAIRNLAFRKCSNIMYDHSVKSAKAKAYSDTGKKISQAKKHGYKIDGSYTYKKFLNANLEKAKQSKDLRDKFISDL